MRTINFQQQPDGVTCTSACLAMILNKPVIDVVGEFHFKHTLNELSPMEYLTSKGIEFKQAMVFDIATESGLYLVAVPGLNSTATFHNILLNIDLEANVINVYDPNKGVLNKRYYTTANSIYTDPHEVTLKHFILELLIKE